MVYSSGVSRFFIAPVPHRISDSERYQYFCGMASRARIQAGPIELIYNGRSARFESVSAGGGSDSEARKEKTR